MYFSKFWIPQLNDNLKEVVFFYKAHIMAGQARPNPETAQDFAWLTKQEIEDRVSDHYWNGVKDILSDH